MPARMVHHFQALQKTTSASWGRMSRMIKPVPVSARFPIPLVLPIEIMLGIFEMMPPEAVVAAICTCWYMHGLYCEEGTFAADELWKHLLARTFPARLTGAPGPNAPPRLRRSNMSSVRNLSNDWVAYVREIRAVRRRPLLLPHPPQNSPAGQPSRCVSSSHLVARCLDRPRRRQG